MLSRELLNGSNIISSFDNHLICQCVSHAAANKSCCSKPYPIKPYIKMANFTDPGPDNKVHGANMGPTWVLSVPDGPHVGPTNLAMRTTYPAEFYEYLKNWHIWSQLKPQWWHFHCFCRWASLPEAQMSNWWLALRSSIYGRPENFLRPKVY